MSDLIDLLLNDPDSQLKGTRWALKSELNKLTRHGGSFYQYNLEEPELQYKVINNYFMVLSDILPSNWYSGCGAGTARAYFLAAMRLFQTHILPKCYVQKNYSVDFMRALFNGTKLNLNVDNLPVNEIAIEVYPKLVECLANSNDATQYKF